jgi:hypothetical protein
MTPAADLDNALTDPHALAWLASCATAPQTAQPNLHALVSAAHRAGVLAPFGAQWGLTDLGRAFVAHISRARPAPSAPLAALPVAGIDWVITGSRHGYDELWDALDALAATVGAPARVLAREQHGVDQEAREWARARGYELVPFEVNHRLDGNQRMCAAARAGGLIAGFPDPASRGTWDCLWRGVQRDLAPWVADWHTCRCVLRTREYVQERCSYRGFKRV